MINELTLFITKSEGGKEYSLVFLEVGGNQYHRPTLEELEKAAITEKMKELARRSAGR